jgi:hypothetical protein
VIALEHHLWRRGQRDNLSFEVLDRGLGVFLTIAYMQKLLRAVRSPKTGQHYAAECLNTILPRLGLIEDSGLVKLPVNESHRVERASGGRAAQNTALHSFWWRIFRLSTLSAILSQPGAYPSKPGHGRAPGVALTASLLALLGCQGLVRKPSRSQKFRYGSVQAAFQATGPP